MKRSHTITLIFMIIISLGYGSFPFLLFYKHNAISEKIENLERNIKYKNNYIDKYIYILEQLKALKSNEIDKITREQQMTAFCSKYKYLISNTIISNSAIKGEDDWLF